MASKYEWEVTTGKRGRNEEQEVNMALEFVEDFWQLMGDKYLPYLLYFIQSFI